MAIDMAVSIEESLALSMRVNATRCVCASTIAMLIGTPISVAYSSAAFKAIDAPAWVSVGSETTALTFAAMIAWVLSG